MTVKGTMVTALDFAKRKGVAHTVKSVCTDGQWYVIKQGLKYCNTFKVTEYDDEGLARLKSMQAEGE